MRIPYLQKRMFGFATFVYAETVRMILPKGNPHFVCDARVLVKPYKEKGNVPEKYRKLQQIERLEFLTCGSPASLDSRVPRDFQLGERMMYNDSQEMMWRRNMEEADLQQALELQSKRLMGLQLLDIQNPYPHHHQHLNTNPFSNTQSCNSPKLPQENCSSAAVHPPHELPNIAKLSVEKESSGKDEDNSDFPGGRVATFSFDSFGEFKSTQRKINVKHTSFLSSIMIVFFISIEFELKILSLVKKRIGSKGC